MAYSATTFEEALQKFQKDFAYRVHTVLVRSGWELPAQNQIKLMGQENGENIWGSGYFHINFKPLSPVSVSYTPISTVVTERKPAQAAERIYRNSSDDPEPNKHTYTHQKDSSKRRLSGTTNMQGLEVENELTVGTGEHASVKVENKTKISVKAEFSQTQERETTETDTEVDTTEVYVSPKSAKRVWQAKWDSKFKEIDEKHMKCDIGFDLHAHRNNIADGIYPNPAYKKTGAGARRAFSVTSAAELRNLYLGISAQHKNMNKNWISADKVIAENIEWLMGSGVFTKIEESVFEQGSYGEVQVEDVDL